MHESLVITPNDGGQCTIVNELIHLCNLQDQQGRKPKINNDKISTHNTYCIDLHTHQK